MAEIYVATNGSDSNAGTKDSPFKTIEKASSVASGGSTVHVAPGNYSGGISTTTNDVTYISDVKHGAKINTGSADMAWDNSGDGVRISGFEVDGSNASFRIGLYTTGTNSVIENSKVHDLATNPNTAYDSSGAAGVYGDGYYGDTNITLRNNEIYKIGPAGMNSSLIHGMYHTTTGTIANNLVHDNAGVGIHLWHDPRDLTIVNNTATNNNMGIYVGSGDHYGYSGPADNINVANNLVYGNRSNGIIEGGETGSNNTYANNLISGNGTDLSLQNGLKASGTITADPKFVKYAEGGSGDFHLAAGSPAINAGTASHAPSTDMDGKARDGAVDVGSLEYGSSSTSTSTSSTTSTAPQAPATGAAKVVVNASGSAALGENAHFTVLIDGKQIGEGTTGTEAKDFAFSTAVAPNAAHDVMVRYDNDIMTDSEDRNLYVNKVTINGKAVLPTADAVTYDKFTLNGVNVIDGQSAMKWNGTLVVDAEKSYFPEASAGAAQADVYEHLVSQSVPAAAAHADDSTLLGTAPAATTGLIDHAGAIDVSYDPTHHLDMVA